MLGYREPEKLTSTMANDQEGKQALKGQGRNQAKVDRRDRIGMVAQECPPRLRWRSSVFDHVLGDGRLCDLEAKLEELAVDARGAPQRVLLAHLPDKIAQFTIDRRPTGPMAGFPAPESFEPRAMPPQDRLRLHHPGQVQQIWPNRRNPYQ